MSWEKVRLEALCTKITDGTHKTPRYVETGVRFLSAKNVGKGYLDFSSCKYITEEEHVQLKKRCFPEAGDVMLSKSGSLGDSVVVPEVHFEFSIFESLALLKTKKHAIRPEFLQHLLSSPHMKRYFRSITTGLAVKHLHLVDLRKMPILLPSIDEQTAIADLLSTWDTAIKKTERLIAAKEERFSWLLNDLLNQGDAISDWKETRLGYLFGRELIVEKGKPLVKRNITRGDIPVVAGGQTYAYYTDASTHEIPTITISASGAYAGFVWHHDYAIWASDCNVIYANGVSLEFYFYVLKSLQVKIYSLQSGGAQPHVYAKDLINLVVPFPTLELQKQIAKTFDAARKEIDLLEKLVDTYRKQKRGLMQKLLTGQWRTKIKVDAV